MKDAADAEGNSWLSSEELKRRETALMQTQSQTCIWCRESPTSNSENPRLYGACKSCEDYYDLIRAGRLDLAQRKHPTVSSRLEAHIQREDRFREALARAARARRSTQPKPDGIGQDGTNAGRSAT